MLESTTNFGDEVNQPRSGTASSNTSAPTHISVEASSYYKMSAQLEIYKDFYDKKKRSTDRWKTALISAFSVIILGLIVNFFAKHGSSIADAVRKFLK